MKKEIYKDLALIAEYNFPFGGAQRMLSIIAKRMGKPIYLPTKEKIIYPVWDIIPINELPKEKIIFSPVVDKYNFQILKNKNQIKFAHSKTSLENFIQIEEAKKIPWLTHRERAYKYWKSQNFNIHLIPRGYIPFDKTKIEYTPNKEDSSVFISRICEDKSPDLAAIVSQKSGIPLSIVGSWEFKEYVRSLIKKYSSNTINFIEPDEKFGISSDKRDSFLKKSKVLIHCSKGNYHDYLEYSILDGLTYNCIPLCITPDKYQFSVIEKKGMGIVVNNIEDANKGIKKIIENYNFYLANAQEYMKHFFENQDNLWKRWEAAIEEIVLNQF